MEILNPNKIYQAQTPQGYSGLHAGFTLPFYTYSYYYADGLQQDFTAQSEISQKSSNPILGRSRPDTFQKDCCDCNSGFNVV